MFVGLINLSIVCVTFEFEKVVNLIIKKKNAKWKFLLQSNGVTLSHVTWKIYLNNLIENNWILCCLKCEFGFKQDIRDKQQRKKRKENKKTRKVFQR